MNSTLFKMIRVRFKHLILLFSVFSTLNISGQYADAGSGNLRNHIWWFDWSGTTISNGASHTFTTNSGLSLTFTFSGVTNPPLPNQMNTWTGSVLWNLYDFTNPAIMPALYNNNNTLNSLFNFSVSATRNGTPVPFTLIAADAEASDLETTTLITNGSNWKAIDFFRSPSCPVSNPLVGCNTQTLNIIKTYGGASGVGQSPVVATQSLSNGTLNIQVSMDKSGIFGGMAVAFGILESYDRGDLPVSFGQAFHERQFVYQNICNYTTPFPQMVLVNNLYMGSIPGDTDPGINTDDNLTGLADEDAINNFPSYNGSGSYSLTMSVRNTTGTDAFLTGWFDSNRDGQFVFSESTTVTVPNNSTTATITWTGLPPTFPSGVTTNFGFRFRIASNTLSNSPTGFGKDGEVEDYFIEFPGYCSFNSDFSYSQNACNPKQVSFSTNSTGFNSIKWDLGDGNTVNALTSFNHLYSSLGTYTVKMIQDFGSCLDTITKTIAVNLQNDNLLIATNDTTICAGTTKQLLAAPSLNFCWSPTTYLNNPGVSNPITSTPQNITYYYTADITGTNLIANGNFNAGNSGFISQYTYTNPNTSEGQYFVGNNPQTWNAALSTCTDHTSGTGNMLMVNGATSPDVVIWKQTITVTPNTNYNFSAWVQSLISSNPAQLQVSINGNLIGNVNTAALATCLWSPLSVNWNSGNATSASITIANKNTQVTGNDFALDDISFASVIKKTDSVKITVSNPLVKTNNDTTFCKGGQVQLNTTGANSYSWSPATGLNNPNIPNPIASPLATTQYIVTGISSAECTAKDTVIVNINNGPIVTKANDTTICQGSQAQLFATGGIAYSWSPAATLNNSSIPNPIATPSVTTTYLVTVTGSNTCTTVDSVKVNIRSQNSFTVSPPLNVCPGKSVQLNAGGGDLYVWTPANSLSNALVPSPIATPGATTMYNVLITDTVCHFSSSLSTLVTVLQAPDVSAIKSNDIDCIYDKSTLSATGAQQYTWSPLIGLTNPQSATTIANPNATTEYFVTGIDVNGCENKDSVTLFVTKTGKAGYLMPSAFTPNGDGLNDCYGLKYWGTITNLEFSIYNRWGERIFFTKNPGECWNGTFKGLLLDTDVFIYQVKASTTCDASIYRKGTFTLIR